jgi:hypothetical protein
MSVLKEKFDGKEKKKKRKEGRKVRQLHFGARHSYTR